MKVISRLEDRGVTQLVPCSSAVYAVKPYGVRFTVECAGVDISQFGGR